MSYKPDNDKGLSVIELSELETIVYFQMQRNEWLGFRFRTSLGREFTFGDFRPEFLEDNCISEKDATIMAFAGGFFNQDL